MNQSSGVQSGDPTLEGDAASSEPWLDASAASRLLGVKRQTLYAYASRGLVRSSPGPGGRARRYRRADLERLHARSAARRGERALAASALRFGAPVLDSQLTEIGPGGPIYRGRSALDLAAGDVPFEAVAELLWTGTLPSPPPVFDPWLGEPQLSRTLRRLARWIAPGTSPLETLAIAVPALAPLDPGRFERETSAVLARAQALVGVLPALLGLGAEPARTRRALAEPTLAARTLVALGLRRSRARERAVNRALVLAADHELNASTFAARIAASAGADPYAAISAALAALSGPLHGGAVERCEVMIRQTAAPERAASEIAGRIRRGSRIPGFGHPLYPDGDPRALALLETAQQLAPRSRSVQIARALVDAVRELRGVEPNFDLGLAALAGALGLEPGRAVGLFALGRSAGWLAHILEQYQAATLLRPRAHYVGVDPRA
ncbi:MAG: citrate/2-methylcitrate synthase [Myxococcota bacterium]